MSGIGKEAAVFYYACLSGSVLFFSYQMLYWFRKLVVHKLWVVGLEDFFYWLSVSVYVFRQIYYTTYGEIRWYFVLGVLVGCICSYRVVRFGRKMKRKYKKYLEKHKENR